VAGSFDRVVVPVVSVVVPVVSVVVPVDRVVVPVDCGPRALGSTP